MYLLSVKLLQISRYTLLEAIRGRLPLLVGVLFVLFLGIVELAAQTAVVESLALRNGLLAVLWRWAAVLVMTLFVIGSMLREFDDRCVQLALAMPVSRSTWLLGRFLGFAMVGWCLVLAACVGFLWSSPLPVVAQWGASLGLELMIVIALGLLSVLSLGSVAGAGCLVLGVYLLGRAIVAIQLIGGSALVATQDLYGRFLRFAVDALAYLLPALDGFTRSEWLVYAAFEPRLLLPIAGQSLVYTGLLLACALFDLHRKSL